MPKIKTNRAAAKRFKAIGNGKFKRAQAYKNHILTKKTTKRKRHLRSMLVVSKSDTPGVARMLPYA